MNEPQKKRIQQALDQFRIETPSWGFANTGTRFGKFLQDAVAIDINDKLADAGQVHAFTGFCPSVAVHVLWDFGANFPASKIVQLGKKYGAIIEWRKQHNWPLDPLTAFRQSGYEPRVAAERKARRIELGITASGSYA